MSSALVKSGMAVRAEKETRHIYLGEWLDRGGVTVTEAAEIAGCSKSYISNISSGVKKNVNALYLLKLSEHLEISINDFFEKPPTEAQVETLRRLSPAGQAAILKKKYRTG